MTTFKIAIDGPSGAGKSTVAKAVAKRLNFVFVDTGAMYRAVGLYVYRAGVTPTDSKAVSELLPGIKIEIIRENGEQKVFLNGEDVSTAIRQNEISSYASDVSKIKEVREFLLELQRETAEKNNVVMDGRDIGTVILPDAQLKIFQTATAVARAERRYKELIAAGSPATFAEVMCDMVKRDENDRTRDIAPAVPAADAVVIDNSDMTLEDNIQAVIDLVEQRR